MRGNAEYEIDIVTRWNNMFNRQDNSPMIMCLDPRQVRIVATKYQLWRLIGQFARAYFTGKQQFEKHGAKSVTVVVRD